MHDQLEAYGRMDNFRRLSGKALLRKRVPIWISRILALALTIGVGVLLLIGVILTSIGPGLWAHFFMMPIGSLWLRLWPYFTWSVSALVLFIAIELLYVLGPSLLVSKRLTLPAAAAATVIWLVLAWELGFYFHHFGELSSPYFSDSWPLPLYL